MWQLALWVRESGAAWPVRGRRECRLLVVVAHFATGRFVVGSILVRAVVHQSTYPNGLCYLLGDFWYSDLTNGHIDDTKGEYILPQKRTTCRLKPSI